MTTPAVIGDLQFIRLVAAADTPPPAVPLAGLVVGLRGTDLEAMGSGPANPGHLAGVFGYSRPYVGPPVDGFTLAAEWVMTPPIPAAVVEAFEHIPGPEGWLVQASHDAYANLGQTLILNPAPTGYPAAVVLDAWQQLYHAAIAEGLKRVEAGYPL